jgi:MFS family permease
MTCAPTAERLSVRITDVAALQFEPALRRRIGWLIFLAIMCIHVGQTVVFAILAPLGREVGLVEWQIGTIITCSSLVFSLASPRWGRLSDRWGRKPVMVLGLVGYTIGTLVFASVFWAALQGWLSATPLFITLVVARMAQSAIMSATSPAATAYLADITDAHERTAAMGMISTAHSIGTIAGPVVAWFAFLSLLAPMYMVAGATLLAAVLVMRGLPDVGAGTRPDTPVSTPAGGRPGLDREVLPFIAVGVAMYTGFAIVQQTLGYYIQDRLKLSAIDTAQQVGYVMLATAVASLASQWWPVRRLGWRPAILMRVGLSCMTLGFAGVGVSGSTLALALSMGLVGLGMGMAGPGFSAAATLSAPAHKQGAVAGLVSASPAMGFIVGPLVGALLYHLNAHLPSWGAAGLFVLLLVTVFRSKRLAVH